MAEKKTNAVRLLEARGVRFRTAAYDGTDGNIDAVSVARKVGASPDELFKTLVAEGNDGAVLVFCVPGSAELDLKKAAAVSGRRSVSLVRAADLFELTGYVRGGCSPIGMKKTYPLWFDEVIFAYEEVYVSAGTIGLQIVIRPEVLLAVTGAAPADLV